MPKLQAEMTVDCPPQEVYRYLKNRYQTRTFRDLCMMTKGYIPDIQRVEDLENECLSFYVAAREVLLKIKLPGWWWSYRLEPIEQHRTRVTIVYRWGVFISVLTFFAVRHQAANELVETALALEALAMKKPPQPDGCAGS